MDSSPMSTPSASSEMSLSQAILAPLNSLFKAQIHAGRSFLSYLLQIGYPHLEVGQDGFVTEEAKKDKQSVYTQDFRFDRVVDGKTESFEIRIPTLALLPVNPLAIDSGEFEFDFKVSSIDSHRQVQVSEEKTLDKEPENFKQNRPWYLVQNPVSLRGQMAPSSEKSTEASQSIKIKIKVSKQPLPGGLDKLLTTLNQSTELNHINP
ncbi:MAG: DUF2589 domain-containing protein [Bacteroidota bacterium]|nr:DUF2589 domain-containing protein [Bacteroidota bacterium]